MALAGLAGSLQYAQFTLETVWGTFNGSASAPNKPWVELEPGALDIQRHVQTKDGMVATGNIPGRRVGGRYEITGTYKTKVFPQLMIPFIPWGCTPALVSSRLTLPSFTIDWFDGLEPRRFRGMRVEEVSWTFPVDAQWGMAEFKLRGKDQDATPPTMTEPAVTAYPTVNPSVLLDTTGFCTFGGSTLSGYRSVKITYKNKLDPQFDELATLNSLEYNGREITWEIEAKRISTARKLLYENQASNVGYLKWAAGVTPNLYTTIFDLQAYNYLDDFKVNRDFDKTQYETLTLKAFRDAATGLDCVATSTQA